MWKRNKQTSHHKQNNNRVIHNWNNANLKKTLMMYIYIYINIYYIIYGRRDMDSLLDADNATLSVITCTGGSIEFYTLLLVAAHVCNISEVSALNGKGNPHGWLERQVQSPWQYEQMFAIQFIVPCSLNHGVARKSLWQCGGSHLHANDMAHWSTVRSPPWIHIDRKLTG